MNKNGNPKFHEIRNTDNSKANKTIKERADRFALELYGQLITEQRFNEFKKGLREKGIDVTLARIALFLERDEKLTPSGGSKWRPAQVSRLIDRLDGLGKSLLD